MMGSWPSLKNAKHSNKYLFIEDPDPEQCGIEEHMEEGRLNPVASGSKSELVAFTTSTNSRRPSRICVTTVKPPQNGGLVSALSKSVSSSELHNTAWNQSEEAKASFIRLLSALYALILVILAFAFEMSVIMSESSHTIQYEVYYMFLYSIGLLYLMYIYMFLLRRRGFCGISTGPMERWIRAFFGIVGIINNGLYLISKLEIGFECTFIGDIINQILSTLFIFVQLYFMFMNAKLTIHRFKDVSRFGAMHLVATNLSVWIKSIVREEYHVMHEIHESIAEIEGHQHVTNKSGVSKLLQFKAAPVHHHKSSSSSEEVGQHSKETFFEHFEKTGKVIEGLSCGQQNEIYRFMDDITPFMRTCLIEYSILCAAVMFVLWRNIGMKPAKRNKPKQSIRVDCSASTRGLFLGLLFLVLTIVSMILFFIKINIRENVHAIWIFYVSFSVLYVIATVACIVGVLQMRELSYTNSTIEQVVLLDDILLFVTLTGQLTYCLFSMVATYADDTISIMSILVNCIRMLQVLLQTIFILAGQRLQAVSPWSLIKKPGREAITFLLMVNIALWLLNTFETQKASSNPIMVNFYGKGPWTVIVHSTVPLCIFYRFHSSVCLAEIWKNAYRTK